MNAHVRHVSCKDGKANKALWWPKEKNPSSAAHPEVEMTATSLLKRCGCEIQAYKHARASFVGPRPVARQVHPGQQRHKLNSFAGIILTTVDTTG